MKNLGGDQRRGTALSCASGSRLAEAADRTTDGDEGPPFSGLQKAGSRCTAKELPSLRKPADAIVVQHAAAA